MKTAFHTAFKIYMSQEKYPFALRVAQRINNMDMIKEVMSVYHPRTFR